MLRRKKERGDQVDLTQCRTVFCSRTKQKKQKEKIRTAYYMYAYAQFDCGQSAYPVSILRKSISGRHRPVRVADGPMTARCRFT